MKKTFLVTGASRGIGFDLVKYIAALGYKVFALSRNTNSLEASEMIFPFNIDITDEIALEKFTNELKQDEVIIDVLINNAGSLANKPFVNTSKEDFENIYRVNVFGLASLTRLLLPIISPEGHVINISSMGGIGGTSKFSGLSAYSSSKGAVNILTEILAEEFKETGPRFNALALGAVQTEMLTKAFPGFQAPISASEMAAYIFKFSLEGHHFFNGKVLPVSSSTP